MVKCALFVPTKSGCRKKCANCKRWDGKKCNDEQWLREMYEESEEFKVYDRMMRGNRAVNHR